VHTAKTIKGYELRERIGSGGFGVVHRAYQSTLGREVAIKIILPHFANHPDFIRRFETEAQLVARLEHPFIVPLYDYWRDPDGAYLVMRWLRGGNLHDSLAQGAFPLEAAALLMDQLGSALALAHRNNIVHRDLKPANILLDEDGNAYLSDFGIAKDKAQAEAALTGSGMLLGSLDYLAPEQARIEGVTARSDIYSLGVVLYQVLTGQHPFAHVSSVERFYMHLNQPLPLIDSLAPEIATGVNAIIQKATAKDPAQRYTDVLEMVADFRCEADLSRRPPESIVEQLTLREQEILQMITEGHSNKEIAEQLFITVGTVRWHIRQVYHKLHVRTRVQAILRARELNLIGSELVGESLSPENGYIALREPENPYKGLRAFGLADARNFFGREHLVQRIIKRLGDRGTLSRFLAIVGPSGSGKSSVVKAGVVPALWRGDLPGSDRWFIVNLVPSAYPFDELEIALTQVAANQTDSLREHLTRDERGLVRLAELILPDDGSELVIIIDQFEEVFTLVDDESARTRFLDLLHTAVTDPRSRARVLITLRADFYDRPLHYPRFGELLLSRMETVLPLSANELEAAITQPAQRVGVSFESGLVSAIIGDIHYQPGALPLLQYALTELFEQRVNGTLTHEAYQALGGAAGALAKRAEEVFHEHDPQGQEIVRQMFLRLVTLGDGTEDTRRRVSRSELLALVEDTDQMDDVIDTFTAYRLLTLDHDPATRRPTVEIAHEAILREWRRLRAWLNESRHDIHQQRLLGAAAADWLNAEKDASYLLHGARLDQFSGWATNTPLALTPIERELLETSITEHERQGTAERERQQRELDTQRQLAEKRRQSANRLRYLVGTLTVFLLAALGLSALALDRERQADHARATSEANLVLAERETAVNRSLVLASEALERYNSGKADLGLALALEAVAIDEPPADAVRALSTVAFGIGTRAILHNQGNKVTAVAFNADASRALSGGCATLAGTTCTAGELIVWDIEAAAELRRLDGHMGWITGVAFDPTRREVALTASEDSTLILWNIETGDLIRRFDGHSGSVNSVAFSADGTSALSGSDDHTVILWDVATGQVIRRFEGHNASVTTVAFSPDGQFVAAGGHSADASVCLWRMATGALVHKLTGPTARVLTMGFRTSEQDQTLVFAYNYDNTYREWDAGTGAPVRTVGVSNAATGMALSPDGRTALANDNNGGALMDISSWTRVAFNFAPSVQLVMSSDISPDGRLALLGGEAGEVILVNLPISQEVRRYHAEGGLSTVDVSPDGRILLTGSTSAGMAILWDVQTGQEIRRLEGLESTITAAAFSPDGRLAVLCSGDAFGGTSADKVVAWDVHTGAVLHEWTGFEYVPRSVAVSPDSRTALIGTLQWGAAWRDIGGGELVLLDLGTGEEIRRFETATEILDVSFSPDGRRAITGNSLHDAVTLWDVTTGQAIRQFDYTSVAVWFTNDSRYFLSGSEGGSIYLVDAETGANIRIFSGRSVTFWSIAVSPDQRYLLGGSGEGQLVLFDFATGELIQHLQAHNSANLTWNVAFSADSQTAFSSSLDPVGDVIEWRIADRPLEDILAWVRENRYVREFTCEERTQSSIEPLCE